MEERCTFGLKPRRRDRSITRTQRDDATQTSSFAIPLSDAWRAGFYFKLVGPAGNPPFGDFEADTANRFWEPTDGADVWVKSGEPDLQSQPMVPVATNVDFVFPLAFGAPNLRIQGIAGDFDNTVNPEARTPIDAIFANSSSFPCTSSCQPGWLGIQSKPFLRD